MEEERRGPERSRRSPVEGLFNLLSVVFVLATLAVVGVMIAIIQNPMIPLNPFPPERPLPTPTLIDFSVVEAAAQAATAVPTELPTLPPAPTPTTTPIPVPSPTSVGVGPGGTNTPAIFPFTLQDEAVTYTANGNGEGCNWLSIAGQVFDIDGNPVVSLPVQVTGENFEQIEFTGTADPFGESGYEVFLNTEPSEAEYEVRLLNTTGMPLSEPVIVRTLDSCEGNVAIVNFVQNREFSR
jgi:hypothetical protein